MDQLCNANTQNKQGGGGLAVFIIITLTVPIQMK